MNHWKELALIMIGLLAVALGIRFTLAEAHAAPLNDSQKSFAINAAREGLKDEIGNGDYNATVQEHESIISTANGDKKVVRVFFTKGNTTLTALVDMNTGNVVEKTSMESSGWMTSYQNQKPRLWVHERLFNR